MSQLQIEQAIFTSAENATMKGYQLVARSPGIDRDVAQQLCSWSPSNGAVDEDNVDQSVLSTFPLSEQRFAVARTILGGPEYSHRGGTQVYTQILVLREDQYARYQCNAFAVAKTAIILGEMRFRLSAPKMLPLVTLPDRPLVPCVAVPHRTMQKYHHVNPTDGVRVDMLLQVLQRLQEKQPIAMIGVDDAMTFASHLIEKIPTDERPTISVTTGLQPTLKRPFRLHFLPELDADSHRVFDAMGVACISTSQMGGGAVGANALVHC